MIWASLSLPVLQNPITSNSDYSLVVERLRKPSRFGGRRRSFQLGMTVVITDADC
jgi:hypothetical protein